MDSKNDITGFEPTQRLGAVLSGIFLICFGMPFTLVPFLILPPIFGESVMLSIFMICFSLPFLFAGLMVQVGGCISLRMALFPESDFTLKRLHKEHERTTSRDFLDEFHTAPSPAEKQESTPQTDIEKSENFWDDVANK
tara:strand:+ start:16994 stop:17410 length:417 start_codon:yes stop_codon:yes gene_type:complete